jgi:hypothetical protein
MELVLGQAEVCHFDMKSLPLSINQEIVWFQIKVNDCWILHRRNAYSRKENRQQLKKDPEQRNTCT